MNDVTAWLLKSQEPAIRALVCRQLLGEPSVPGKAIVDGPLVSGLLAGQVEDGGFGGHPYKKWQGAHWRLVSLVELGIPPDEPRARAALEPVLDWLAGDRHVESVRIVDGRARRCGSQEGNALAVACRLGMAGDPRAGRMARGLIGWQWPDGGWNCDGRPEAQRSSFHETLPPLWGLHEYGQSTGDTDATVAAVRAAELLLDHGVYKKLSTGEPIHREWMTVHWPPYWHYDVLQALVILDRLGFTGDPRLADAREVIRRRRRGDGRWRSSSRWWNPPGSTRAPEAVDWKVDDADDRIVTLRALTVLREAPLPAADDLS